MISRSPRGLDSTDNDTPSFLSTSIFHVISRFGGCAFLVAIIVLVWSCASVETKRALQERFEREGQLMQANAEMSAQTQELSRMVDRLQNEIAVLQQGGGPESETAVVELRERLLQAEAALDRSLGAEARLRTEIQDVRGSMETLSRMADAERDASASRVAMIGGSLAGTALRATVGLPPAQVPTQPGSDEEGGFPWKTLGGAALLLATQYGRTKNGATPAEEDVSNA
jgi:hypothetical protein